MAKKAPEQSAQQKRNIAEYKKAVKDLNTLSDRLAKAGIREETPAYHKANKKVLDIEKRIGKKRGLLYYMFGI